MKVLNVQKKDDGDKVYWKIMPPAKTMLEMPDVYHNL